MNPTTSDGQPLIGDVIAVLDESSPPVTGGGIAYVVTAAAIITGPALLTELAALFGAERTRPFHYTREGVGVLRRMTKLLTEHCVVATAQCTFTGRKGQVAARRHLLPFISDWLGAEGATHLVIEASDAATMGRDQAHLLDHHRASGGVPFAYDWRTKSEPVLWVADFIAGVVSDHVIGKDSAKFESLVAAGVVQLHYR